MDSRVFSVDGGPRLPSKTKSVCVSSRHTPSSSWCVTPLGLRRVIKCIYKNTFWCVGLTANTANESEHCFWPLLHTHTHTYSSTATPVDGVPRHFVRHQVGVQVVLHRDRLEDKVHRDRLFAVRPNFCSDMCKLAHYQSVCSVIEGQSQVFVYS